MTVTTVQPLAPTSLLPPIANIATSATAQLFESLQYLYRLYRPHVRGSRRRRRESSFPPHDEDHDVQCVRSDAFERAYAIRWLTAFIAQLGARGERSASSSPTIQLPTESDPPIDTDSLIQQAASLLATCAGVAAAGKVQRDFSFESAMAGQIHVVLTDIPLDNHDYGSVGAQTWGGACVLAEMIAEHPDRFGLVGGTGTYQSLNSTSSLIRTRPLRILELGAGTGLVGLTVAKLLQALPHSKEPNVNLALGCQATIILTDFYPAVLDNLQFNINANFSTAVNDAGEALSISSHPLDWSSFSTANTVPEVFSTPFDVILGADIVYEAQHAVWIRDCLKCLLSSPDSSNEQPVFHLVIPLRQTHTFESSTVEEVFGPKDRVSDGTQRRELTVLSKESIFCEAYSDGLPERSCTDNDVEYVYYRIGWA